MLYKQAVQPSLINCLESLMQLNELKDFRLVGGTALALRLGHRKSIDIDLFTDSKKEINFDALFTIIEKKLPYRSSKEDVSTQGLRLYAYPNFPDVAGGIKIEIFKWIHPFLTPTVVEEGIRMASFEDIAAMKIEAVVDRREIRDYIDIVVLSEHFTLAKMIVLYKKRTLNPDETGVIRILSKANEANKTQDVKMLKQLSWTAAKKQIEWMIFVYKQEKELLLKNKLAASTQKISKRK